MATTKNGIYINKRIRYNGKKVDIFDVVNRIKEDLKKLFPEIEEKDYLAMFSHIKNKIDGKLFYGKRTNPENFSRKRELTKEEIILWDYLKEKGYNPSTAYRWMLHCRIPQDLIDKLKEGKISSTKAYLISNNRKKSKMSSLGLLMIETINTTIKSL